VAGPPAPARGLMADPADIQKQLEFMAGVMGLPRGQRAQAGQLFDAIMGRASQAQENRIGRQFQAGENQLSRAQAQQHWEGTEARIGNQFERQMEHNQEQFAFEREKFGDEFAFRQKQHRDQQALAWASENRQQNRDNLLNAGTRLDILAKQQGLLAGPEVKLPTGYRAVTLPTGVPTDQPLGRGVAGPVRTDPGQVVAAPIPGTPDWTKAQEGMDAITTARQNIRQYQEHFQKHGAQQFGAEAGKQKEYYERVVESVRVLKNTGVLNVGEIPILREELPDPTAIVRAPILRSRITSQLTALDETFGRQEQILRERYRGWQLRIPEKREEERGRAAPPEGSVPMGGSGRYGGRGSSR